MKLRSLYAALCFISLVGCVSHKAGVRDTFLPGVLVTPYQGRYQNHEVVRPILERAETLRAMAIKKAVGKIGIQPPLPENIILRFVDTANMPNTATKKIDGHLIQVVTIPFDVVVQNNISLEETLHHEMVHAVMRNAMGCRYHDLPKWFREGIAVWAAGQTQEKLAVNMATLPFRLRENENLLDGLERDNHDETDYFEDAMAVHWLATHVPIPELLREIVTEKGYYKGVIMKRTNMGWPDVEKSVKSYAEKYLQDFVVSGEVESFKSANRQYLDKNYDEALVRFDNFKKDFPKSMLMPAVIYWMGKIHYKGKRYAEAAELFEEVVKTYPRHSTYLDDSVYRLAKCYTQLERHEKALQLYDFLLRDFGQLVEPMKLGARFFMGRSLLGLGDREKALLEFKHVARKRDKYGQDAYYYWVKTLRDLEQLDEAEQTLNEFREKYPKSSLVRALSKTPGQV